MKEDINKKESFTEIFREYFDGLFSKILKKIKDENLAKDIVIETFEKFKEWQPIIKDKKIDRWLLVTASHIAVNYFREREKVSSLSKEEDNIPNSSLNPEELFIKRSEWEKIMEISKKFLNKTLYEIFDLYFIKGHLIKEIAQMKNTTEGAIKKDIFKIRRIIYERLPKSIKEKYLKRR